MNKLDKWCAEQCGVEIRHSQSWCLNDNPVGAGLPLYRHYGWTIADPRCREIVRERFRIDSYFVFSEPECAAITNAPIITNGNTIAEAEIACITAIYEAEASSEAREARDE